MLWKRAGKPVIAVLLSLLILSLFGFRIEHPKAGLANAVGSAQSSVVIVKKADKYVSGDKIVADTQVGVSPVLGIVAGVTEESIEVILDKGVARTTQEDVSGKLLFVIPFIGTLLGWVGL